MRLNIIASIGKHNLNAPRFEVKRNGDASGSAAADGTYATVGITFDSNSLLVISQWTKYWLPFTSQTHLHLFSLSLEIVFIVSIVSLFRLTLSLFNQLSSNEIRRDEIIKFYLISIMCDRDDDTPADVILICFMFHCALPIARSLLVHTYYAYGHSRRLANVQ